MHSLPKCCYLCKSQASALTTSTDHTERRSYLLKLGEEASSVLAVSLIRYQSASVQLQALV